MATLTNPDPHGTPELVPLEANPVVLSNLLTRMGLSSSLALHDVFSLSEPELLAMVPRPAYALLLVFPVSAEYESQRIAEDALVPEYNGSGATEPVVWFHQTVGNMCGLVALLHASLNGPARERIEKGSILAKLLQDAIPLGPVERARLLGQSQTLLAAHQDAAAQGDSAVPSAAENVDLHFVCFVRADDGHLWELDGRRGGPLDRGLLEPGSDVLSECALALGPRAFLARGEDVRFSCLALGPAED